MSTSNDDAYIDELYEDIPGDHPPESLDQRILAAAHREVNAGPTSVNFGKRRPVWIKPAASAAVLLLAITVSLYQVTDPSAPLDVASDDKLVGETAYRKAVPNPSVKKEPSMVSGQDAALPKREQHSAEFASSAPQAALFDEMPDVSARSKSVSSESSAGIEPQGHPSIAYSQGEGMEGIDAESAGLETIETDIAEADSAPPAPAMAEARFAQTLDSSQEAPPELAAQRSMYAAEPEADAAAAIEQEEIKLDAALKDSVLLTESLLDSNQIDKPGEKLVKVSGNEAYYWVRVLSPDTEKPLLYRIDRARFIIPGSSEEGFTWLEIQKAPDS